MPEETQIEVIPPKSKFDLRQVKSGTYNENVSAIMSATGLERYQVEGVLGDLVMQDKSRESQGKIAARWGVGFGEVSRCRMMGKLTIDECRESLGTKSIILAHQALDAVADDMADPVKVAAMKTKDKLSIAKQMTDNALNLENKAVGGNMPQHIDVGTVQILIQNREAREKEGGSDAVALLLARGLNPKLVEKA